METSKLILNGEEYYFAEGQSGWQPGANTVAYYPMISDILDHSGNNNNFTGSGYSFSNNKVILTSDLSGPLVVPTSGTEPRTVIAWISYSSSSSEGVYKFADGIYGENGFIMNNSNGEGGHLKIGSSWYEVNTASSQTFDCIALVRDGTSLVVYINGNLLNTATIARNDRYFQYATSSSTLRAGTYGEIIVENKARTATEISNYYNQTKDQYQPSEPQTEPCHVCGGTGEEECDMCGGTGQEMCPTCSGMGQIGDPEDPESRTACPDCDGTGFISCGICDGTGMITCPNCGGTGEEPGE